MIEFASKYDPQFFHLDAEAAKGCCLVRSVPVGGTPVP